MKSKGKKLFKPRRINFQKKKSLFTLDSDVSDDESELVESDGNNKNEVNLLMTEEVLNENEV